jgi:hypothetical protein
LPYTIPKPQSSNVSGTILCLKKWDTSGKYLSCDNSNREFYSELNNADAD